MFYLRIVNRKAIHDFQMPGYDMGAKLNNKWKFDGKSYSRMCSQFFLHEWKLSIWTDVL